jgi:hypothetical protein
VDATTFITISTRRSEDSRPVRKIRSPTRCQVVGQRVRDETRKEWMNDIMALNKRQLKSVDLGPGHPK